MKSKELYSPEFRAEAVRLVLEQGLSQAEAARRLGIAKGTLANWVVAELVNLTKLRKLLELRLELEVAAAGMAARRRTQAKLVQLTEAVVELERATNAHHSQLQGELSFSRALADASGNEYFDNFIMFLSGHVFEAIGRVKTGQAKFARDALAIVAERREILNAIALGDPDLAKRATWRHILNTAERLGLKGLQGCDRTRMSALGEAYAPLCLPACLPPDRQPKAANFTVPEGACDCHMHVFGPVRHYPLAPHRSYTPAPASLVDYRKAKATLGVSRGVVVQPSVYGTDNRMVLEVLNRGGGKFRGGGD